MAEQSMCSSFRAGKVDAAALCVARGREAEAICHGQATARTRDRARRRRTALMLALAVVAGTGIVTGPPVPQ
jgi:hypothetical protein